MKIKGMSKYGVRLHDGRISNPPDDALVLPVSGAGWIAFGSSAGVSCGEAKGCSVDPSWGRYGYAGGVMDKADIRRLRDHLNTLLNSD